MGKCPECEKTVTKKQIECNNCGCILPMEGEKLPKIDFMEGEIEI